MKKQETAKKLEVYIDGSCRPSTKLGAYAVMLIDEKGKKEVVSGTQEDTTNNVMELTALVEALKFIKANKLDEQFEIDIYSDSQYVVTGLTEWWPKWEKNNFVTSAGKKVKNLGIWKELVKLSDMTMCTLNWIKGHSTGDKYKNTDPKHFARHNEVDALVFSMTQNNKTPAD